MGREARPSGSLADQPSTAPVDPTVALPVAEKGPDTSTHNAPTGAGTIDGGADTPSTGISAFPDLSQETEHGELTGNTEDDGEDVAPTPEGGGPAIRRDLAASAEEWAGFAPANLEDSEKLLDLGTQQSTECDEKLIAVYGDTTHRNDGRHLHGGVADDVVWQERYDRVVAHPHKLYFPPQGQVGKQVVATYARELKGVRERRWNSERPLVFLTCILRRRPGCTRSKDIKRRVENRLRLWEEGKYDALVQDVTNLALNDSGGHHTNAGEEQEARTYNSSVLDGKLRSAFRLLNSSERGDVLGPEDKCTKTGVPVLQVLQAKHPDQRVPDLQDPDNIAFRAYPEIPDPIPIDCTPAAVESVAKKLTGAAGCSGVDSALLKCCLLRYGKASSELREELLDWTLWLANSSPPWAAYRAMRQGRLVALDKQPGVRPVGIGECWMRAVSKLVLVDCAKEGKAACGSTQLCAGLEAVIEGAIHSIRTKACEDKSIDFEEWELDDDLWQAAAEAGETPPWDPPVEESFQDTVKLFDDIKDPSQCVRVCGCVPFVWFCGHCGGRSLRSGLFMMGNRNCALIGPRRSWSRNGLKKWAN